MLQQHGNMEKKVQENVTQLWNNQSELKGGMDAAEFNLRAHQKVLNSLAIEFERLVTHLNDEIFKTEHELLVLELAEVTIPSDTGEAVRVVRRLDWPYYHTQVDKEMRALKEAEELRAAQEEQQRLAENDVLEKTEEVPLPPQDSIPEGATVFGG
jgi:formyltetrahydrofolate hydrolase